MNNLNWLLEGVKAGFISIKEALALVKYLEWIEKKKKEIKKENER